MEQFVIDACNRRSKRERRERMVDYVVAGLTIDQVLEAEKAYSRKKEAGSPIRLGHMTTTRPKSPDGSEESVDEMAGTSVKEKFEDLLIRA